MSSEGRVAVVTGAAGHGMGRSIALTLAREGASVVVNYLNSKDRAKEVVEFIEGNEGRATAVQANVFVKDGCEKSIQEQGGTQNLSMSLTRFLHLKI